MAHCTAIREKKTKGNEARNQKSPRLVNLHLRKKKKKKLNRQEGGGRQTLRFLKE